MTFQIPLVRDTISRKNIDALIQWLGTYPRLTKGELTLEFERQWSTWLGTEHSAFVSSGSAANLAAVYALVLSKRLKNKKVVVPAVSWSTTVAPIIQLGLEPILCDCNKDNLGLDIEHLASLMDTHQPSLLITVNVLGFSNDYTAIKSLCKQYGTLILEDSCESIGTICQNQKTGTFGDISTFSFYFGHHMSTIEGGMICTNDEELSDLIKSIRSHGWDRDLSYKKQTELRSQHQIDDFRALYSFYYPGFNLRATDLQAFIGLEQIQTIEQHAQKRHDNFALYQSMCPTLWPPNLPNHDLVSNFSYPVITDQLEETINALTLNKIECRPLVCGSMGQQPFWIEHYGRTSLPNADIVHNKGLYLPNNPAMTKEEIYFVCETVSEVASATA